MPHRSTVDGDEWEGEQLAHTLGELGFTVATRTGEEEDQRIGKPEEIMGHDGISDLVGSGLLTNYMVLNLV